MTQNVRPGSLGYKVSSRTINWESLVVQAWGSEFRAPDHGVYEFSNGRRFDSTDQSQNGFYTSGNLSSGALLGADGQPLVLGTSQLGGGPLV